MHPGPDAAVQGPHEGRRPALAPFVEDAEGEEGGGGGEAGADFGDGRGYVKIVVLPSTSFERKPISGIGYVDNAVPQPVGSISFREVTA